MKLPLSLTVQLPLLLALISIVYSATRYDEWGSILTEAMRWGFRMALFLLAIAVTLYLLAEFVIGS